MRPRKRLFSLNHLSKKEGMAMAKNMVALKAGGVAGTGVFTIGAMFARSLQKMGLCVFYTADYPSLIKGGHNTCYVRVEQNEVFSQIKTEDILVALDKKTVELHFRA